MRENSGAHVQKTEGTGRKRIWETNVRTCAEGKVVQDCSGMEKRKHCAAKLANEKIKTKDEGKCVHLG